MKNKCLFMMLTLLASGIVNAALVIDYTGNDKSTNSIKSNAQSPYKKQSLLLDNSVQWATFVESDKCIDKVVSGSGNNISLDVALRMLTPSGWKVYADDGVELENAFVSWRSGTMWTKIIADSAEKYQFQVVFNCGTRELTIKNAPELGVLAKEANIESQDIGALPPSEFIDPNESKISAQPVTSLSVSAASPLQTRPAEKLELSMEQIEPVPYGNESASSYMNRYAKHYGFNRVAYRFKNTDINTAMRMNVSYKNKSNTFAEFLRNNHLLQLNGLDAITNESVMVVTDDLAIDGNSKLVVFPVAVGMLSNNATEMAASLGLSIGENNKWPNERLAIDYKVPFAFDLVMTEPIDGFAQLFSNYPLQAQFIMGGSQIYVVKRNTANRK